MSVDVEEMRAVLLFFSLSSATGLSVSKGSDIAKEAIRNVVQLKTEVERKSEGEIEVELDRFSGGICLLDEHCAFFRMMGNITVQISYCDYSAGKQYSFDT